MVTTDHPTAWPPGTAVLLYCARWAARPEGTRIVSFPDGPLDWNAVAYLASLHAFEALLLDYAAAADVRMTSDVRAGIEERVIRSTAQNLLFTRQLRDVMEQFRIARIPALAYKGPTLAVLAYGHVGRRPFLDLDVLVPRSRVREARACLRAMGYTMDAEAHRLFAILPPAGKEDHFRHPDARAAVVELHVAFASWPMAVRLDTEALLDRSITVDVAGTPIPTLCREDLLLVLCAHASLHRWSVFRHVFEIAAIAAAGLDWNAVLERAASSRLRRELRTGLLLARDVCAVQLPAHVDAFACSDRTAAAIARERLDLHAQFPTGETRWQNLWQHMRQRERVSDKLRYFARNELQTWLLKVPWERWL